MGLIRKIDVQFRYMAKAIKNINKPHIGDEVTYKGVKCSLIQGVANPYWNLLPLTKENLAKSKRDIYNRVHVSDFKLKPLRKRFWFSFMFTYSFLMDYWWSIDIRYKGKISYPG